MFPCRSRGRISIIQIFCRIRNFCFNSVNVCSCAFLHIFRYFLCGICTGKIDNKAFRCMHRFRNIRFWLLRLIWFLCFRWYLCGFIWSRSYSCVCRLWLFLLCILVIFLIRIFCFNNLNLYPCRLFYRCFCTLFFGFYCYFYLRTSRFLCSKKSTFINGNYLFIA